MSSCATDGSGGAPAASGTAARNGSGPGDSISGSTTGSILCNTVAKGKNPEDDPDEDPSSQSDAITYRGIYLPTLTNRFRDKKLETAYQRYACRQVSLFYPTRRVKSIISTKPISFLRLHTR